MKELLECTIEELFEERLKSIQTQNITRFRECNELISTWINEKTSLTKNEQEIVKKLELENKYSKKI